MNVRTHRDGTWGRLCRGDHSTPHEILGAHADRRNGHSGIVVRALHPDAVAAACLLEDCGIAMERVDARGVFEAFLPKQSFPFSYRLRFDFADGQSWERGDPYAFLPTIGEADLYYFGEGTHRRLWQVLGAHLRSVDGVEGASFAVWAPNARRVSVIGDFCGWDGRLLPMRSLGASGVFELFVPGVRAGARYKYEIKTASGELRIKADPFAFACEHPPANASVVTASGYEWRDREWMTARETCDPVREAMSIYEVHLGSWRRKPDGAPLGYREVAEPLLDHVIRHGFTHVQLMAIAEHPFEGSWGYQVTGYYAPTARLGAPDDLRYFVDECHRRGVGVLLDWVPAHFPKDDFALRLYDGTALYEHADPRKGEHPDWGTLIFNYGRNEVRNFLVANALYWLHEFHIDGLRIDAVASMLYLDYSRKHGEWIPNRYGGRENIEAADFLREVNRAIRDECPGAITAAEESTAWPGVTAAPEHGGLGFTFKWNMGWMHDTLRYFARDRVHRRYHQDELTFAMLYEYHERFIMPLSHDEVVHGKRALLEKLPGDIWQKFADLRLILAYQWTRPGKKLLFMGTEIAPYREWNIYEQLDWSLTDTPERRGLARYFEAMGNVYRSRPCLWEMDHEPGG
ncbi:MAG TPA: 1,4-alpha-glucan branching protein GlgB, partial [Candidatus Binatia bacterium]|nr:1,4-alpha-glucan branching protein GlgB [Candidatus Binatia bacterium]